MIYRVVTSVPTTQVYKWVSPQDGTSQSTLYKIITTRPGSSSTPSLTPAPGYNSPAASPSYYHYSTGGGSGAPTRVAGYYGTSPHYGGSSSYSTASSSGSSGSRPTTNPPAPTVIVLGPLGTEYTTVPTAPTRVNGPSTHISKYPQSSNTNRPFLVTKKPGGAPTLTHNISTIISGNKHQVVQVSYVQVNVKDGTTSRPIGIKETLEPNTNIKLVTKRPAGPGVIFTSWTPEKPIFQLKPSSPSYHWPPNSDNKYGATRPGGTTPNCEDAETAPSSDDVNNFPPVRHPELESPDKDKPTEIITEDEIPTPDFVEDAELNNKVDVFVNKIVQSLQGNFQSLKEVVYNPKNVTTIIGTQQFVTKRPPGSSTIATTRRPTATRPSATKATRRPSTKLTTTTRTPSARPRPTTVSPTRRPSVTTRRTKPVKKVTTPLGQSEDYETTTVSRPIETTTSIPEITPNADFRKSKLLYC